MLVEGGSDRQQAGFLIIAAVGFLHRNVKLIARHLFNWSNSMFPISLFCKVLHAAWNHSVEQNNSQKLLKVADTLKQKNVNKHTSFQ